ncbi:MAG: LPS-assembly protein LptD [Bacteroidetes bacterium]|uniref:LPS-assembly protein LptD n=1 Tax=Candidatus Cryptobacteroides intestinavium TaxID=2840766 RepID=A0A9D9EP06_9BACT|nr:LPS-assembly protein LptD [Candidatus Cryptobacteroides intestinavium]
MSLFGPGNKMSSWEKLLSIVILLSVISSFSVSSQDDRRSRRNRLRNVERTENVNDTVQMTDSMRAIMDSIKFVRDSTARADSIARRDSIDLLSKSSLEQPAFSAAKDSIIEDFSDGKRMIYYYGDVSVTYGTMKLTADYMEYDMQKQTVYARGTKDTTGAWVGQPTMEDGGKTYTMEEVRYNFETRKARITNMITQESEGILHGQNIKMMPDQSINITKGKYTVCDCEHPHYYLHLTAAKVMTKPSQRTVFGPAYPVIEDVPLFPVVLPFGFIPKRPDRATGFLMPTFGEEASRGFFIRDVGMYFVIGDYFDLSLTGDIFTLGSWAVDVNSRYKVNYKCNGNFALTYSNDQTGEKGSEDFFQTRNFAVRWSHSQDSKANPGMSFSASVNFSSPSNNRYNSTSVEEALQNQISSSISWSKNWGGKINLSVNALHSQSSRDSSYAFTLPNVTLSVSRFYPFKQKNRVGKKKFYEDFSLGYNTTLQNKINFKASEFNQPGFWDKFQNGMTHNFQIGLPNFTLFKYINFTPSISYSMNWFFRKTDQVYNPETDSIEEVDSGMFNHFGATHNYSGGISASTRLYGLFNFGKHHKLQAIRHVITPSVSFSFSPEKATYFNGYRTLNYVDNNGVAHSTDYNIYTGQLYSAPGRGKTASMSLTIGNNLEAKVRDLQDTTGTGTKKIKLIDNLSLNTGYNFLADSLNMSNIGISLSTSVFGKVGVSGNANFSPYAVVPTGERTYATVNRFNGSVYGWDKPLRLTNASLSLSYSFSGEGKINGNDGTAQAGGNPADNYTRIYYHPVTGEYIPGGWLYYMNPNAPWSVNLNYSFNYSRSYSAASYQLLTNHRYTQTLGISGNVKLTPALALNLTTGFDLMAMKMTTTQLSATYDLHCFNISVSWVPTGTWQSWSFRIAANAAALADLLRFKKSNSYWDNF